MSSGPTRLAVVLVIGALHAQHAAAATRRISVFGVDQPDAGAWRTFAYAFKNLQPGDVLEVGPGVYSRTDGGLIDLDCSDAGGNGPQGTAAQPVVVRAVPERGAVLDGDGHTDTVLVDHCRYWTFEGLTIRTADYAGAVDGFGMQVVHSSQVVVRRMLISGHNRCGNNGALLAYLGDHITFEENEVYDFANGGIILYGPYSIARRNYANSRGRRDVACYASGDPSRGDEGLGLHDSFDVAENNITEGNGSGISVYPYGDTTDILMAGNISIADGIGAICSIPYPDVQLVNPTYSNAVALRSPSVGLYFREARNARCEHCTMLAGQAAGFIANDINFPDGGKPGLVSASVVDSLAAFNDAGTGFSLSGLDQGQGLNVDSFGNRTATSGSFSGTRNVDPMLGGCLVFIPESSPLKHAGLDGGDIGANVLYRTENGVETQQPLWDPTTGAFPCGAIVPGINDVPDASCFDVHVRLHVGTLGCALPDAYRALADAGVDGGADGGPNVSTDGGGDYPVARVAPAEQTARSGDTVTLDASGSTPSSGAAITTFAWDQPRGPTGVKLASGPQQSLTLTEPGRYDFRLVVTDSAGKSSQPRVATVVVQASVSAGCGCSSDTGLAAVLLALLCALRLCRRTAHPGA